jgi:hypothetical protein
VSCSTIVTATKPAMINHLKTKTPYLECQLIYRNHLEYVEKRIYRSLKRARIGFKIAKKDGDHDKMKYYAEGIQKFERQLHPPVSDFTDVFKEARNGPDSQTKRREKKRTATDEL